MNIENIIRSKRILYRGLKKWTANKLGTESNLSYELIKLFDQMIYLTNVVNMDPAVRDREIAACESAISDICNEHARIADARAEAEGTIEKCKTERCRNAVSIHEIIVAEFRDEINTMKLAEEQGRQ